MNADFHKEEQFTDNNSFNYTTVSGDPNKVRIYTLKNGLQVFLAQNFDAPRIQTYIPVRTGSNNDPSDNTGLSHYLEHMMFKGTSKIGTQDWTKEKALLDEIENLYEQHKTEENPEKKKQIYKKIDEVSQEASKFAIANEYDKAISSLGATGTNAHTWLDETVYKNNIPNNELEKWLQIEHERFSELVLRLFHTELESVYEEFNRAQDNDSRLVNYALMEELFPKHPNGQQTTLGKAEHLKNPSMKAIYKYFDEFYVPNNYAIVLVGDLDFEETIFKVNQYFGNFEYKELPKRIKVQEQPMTSIVKRELKSPTIRRVQLAWRTDDYGSREWMLADVIANILSNKGEAGLLDLNINQTQRALYANAFSVGFREYGYFSVVIVPKEEQNLDEGVNMLLEQIDLVKKGDFPDWLIDAIINDFKLQRMKAWETADGLASNIYDVYIKRRSWADELNEMLDFEAVTKEEIMTFAQGFFKDNYVAIYKEKGENENLIRVENPGITPIQLNRDAQSVFLNEFLAIPEKKEIQPQFIDYQKEIHVQNLEGKKLSFVKNKYNDIAEVHYIFSFGSDNDKELGFATQVLQYLGTSDFTPEALRQEFFKIGISTDFKTSPDQIMISVSGLEENLEKGVELLHHWLENVVPDEEAYQNFVQTIMESRDAAKKDKTRIMNMLTNYAKLGAFSRYTDVISKQRLDEINVDELMNSMRDLFKNDYQIFYYGKVINEFISFGGKFIKATTEKPAEAREYPEPITGGKVYFTPYDMVQMEMSRVGKGENVEVKDFGKINVFNEYFGRGLSSIVFQEMREAKSLAYSAYVSYLANGELQHPDYVQTYIGTQPDKLKTAIETLGDLMQDLPQVPLQFENAKNMVLKQIASTRITRTNIFFNTLKLKKLGIDYDYRKDVYEEIKKLELKDLMHFYNQKVKAIHFNTAIIGKKENLNTEVASTLGELKEVSLEEIFGY